MKGDFSRITFDRTNHYSGVRWQQGRPTTDADENEAQDIATYRVETETIDVVGQSGAPKHQPGFGLAFAEDGALQIGAGRMYVDGILCENDAPLTYATQPDLPDAPSLADLLGSGQIGLVYLDVFKRHLTYQDRDAMRDVALNGVDTTTRLQTVWQVKVLPLGSVKLAASARKTLVDLSDQIADLDLKIAATTDPAERAVLIARRRPLQRRLEQAATRLGVSCDSAFPEWDELTTPRTGALTVTTVPGGTPDDPCDVPPGGGYTRGENQLYIVQVHSVAAGGARAGATFKWSRDNGSIAARITAVGSAQSGTASGTVFDVDSVQRDDYLGIHTDDLVEYVDDSHELNGLPGELRRVTNADVNLGRITLDSSLSVNLDRNPRLRKWDQPGGAAIAMNTTAAPIVLENGVQVEFADGTYQPGDYWQFAARAVDASIDFPSGPQPAFGVGHHYARLGLVIAQREQQRLLLDCRSLFPPLTELTADDVSFDNTVCNLPDTQTVQDAIEQLCAREGGGGTCTFTVAPGATWFEVFERIEPGGDAEICFAVGAYELADTVVIEKKGHLRLHGAGDGTRIIARASESALTFRGCESVTIADLAIEARRAGPGDAIRGAVTCEDCAAVTLDSAELRCVAATLPAAACLRVANNPQLVSAKLARGTVDVRNCRMLVGHNQIGALITNCARAHFDNNIIRCVDGRSGLMRIDTGLAENRELQAELRRVLYSDVQLGEARDQTRLTLVLANTVVNMRVDPRLMEIKLFNQLTELFSPDRVRDLPTAETYLSEAVDNLLLKPETIDRFVPYFKLLLKWDEAALYQGITVGGQVAGEVRISNATIVDALQGVHIGQSAAGDAQPLSSGTVHITGNTIGSRITPSVNREAHGVLIGNCESLLVEGNRIEREAIDATQHLLFDGVHAAGLFGRRLIVRHNQTERFSTGILVDPSNKLPKKNSTRPPAPGVAPQWLVADNTGTVVATSEWVRVENNVD
jgi:hypothetical protein